MEKTRNRGQNVIHHRQRGIFSRFIFAEDFGLRCFNEPVAVIAPDKIVEPLRDCVELVIAIRFFDCVDRFVQSRQNFDREDRQFLWIDLRRSGARSVHLPEPGDVPKFGGEVAPFFDLFFVEPNVLTARSDPHQAETQTVRSIFID